MLFSLLILFSISIHLKSQLIGYCNPGDPAKLEVGPGRLFYADSNICVTYYDWGTIFPYPTGPKTGVFHYRWLRGSLNVNDHLLIYSPHQGRNNVGRYVGGIIKGLGTSSHGPYLEIEFPSGSMLSAAFALTGTSVMLNYDCFMIKIPTFKEIKLSGGVITTHQFDGTQGGIGAIITDKLIISSGTFDVSGKSYSDQPNYGFITTGKGGMPTSSYSGAGTYGGQQNNARNCMNLWSGCDGDNGTNGGAAGTPGTDGSGTTQPLFQYMASSDYNGNVDPRIVPGNTGYMQVVKGSEGGQGGGYGGNGGDACNQVNPGQSGSVGKKGADGYFVTKLASGGGAFIIKAKEVVFDFPNYSNIAVVFNATGATGPNGAQGGNGGLGGEGGLGGLGLCDAGTISHSGGNGGWGEPGVGGKGSDGMPGGEPGTIWLLSQNVPTDKSGNPWWSNALVETNQGKGGKGGAGGFSVDVQSALPQQFNLSGCSPYTWCPPQDDIPEKCDCNKVIEILAGLDKSIFSTSSGDAYFYKTGGMNIQYDAIANVARTSVDPLTQVKYFCPMYHNTECNRVWAAIAEQSNPSSGVKVDLTKTTGTLSSYPQIITWNNSAGSEILNYSYTAEYFTLTSAVGSPKCNISHCPPELPAGAVAGKSSVRRSGASGSDYPYQNIVAVNPYNQTGKFYMNGNTPAPQLAAQEEIHMDAKPNVFPNPVSEVIMVRCTDLTAPTLISVTDLNGKLIMQESYQADKYENVKSLNATLLNTGVYLVRVLSAGQTYTFKIIKK